MELVKTWKPKLIQRIVRKATDALGYSYSIIDMVEAKEVKGIVCFLASALKNTMFGQKNSMLICFFYTDKNILAARSVPLGSPLITSEPTTFLSKAMKGTELTYAHKNHYLLMDVGK